MNSARLESLLKKVLGDYYKSGGDKEAIFHCPFCNHSKKKLNVNLISHAWHCWVCNAKGKSIWTLFRKLKVPESVTSKLDGIIPSKRPSINHKEGELVLLPAEYHRLDKVKNDPEYKNAVSYLKRRGVNKYDILRYNIGYCEEGPFSSMIIIPSYDSDGNLNFYSGRCYYEVDDILLHKNCDASKDVVGFENQINWEMPVVICEGGFDAIAIRINAIPLFGKMFREGLKNKIVRNRPPAIYLALDPDAFKDSIKAAKFFMDNGIKTYIVDLREGDPSEIGHRKFVELKEKAKELTFGKMIEYRLL
tara:strand:- start:83 stop:997 length:915 start_codon:yes stop_codon:yes gene_type:complete